MANTSCNCGGETKTPGDIVCDYHKGLKDGRAATQSERDSSRILIAGSEMARGYKLCSLSKTEETFAYYRDIDNYELFDIQKSTEIIKVHINNYAKKDDELSNLIKEGSKMLNALKAKLLEANNASCAMRNCLQSVIGFGDHCVPDELTAVTDLARSLSEDGQKAAEAMVTTAGIHTFANLNTLKPFGEKLTQVVKDLKTLTDGYVKKAGEDAKVAQTDLTTVIDDLNKEEFDYFEQTSTLNAYDGTIRFICEGQCPSIGCVETICLEVSATEPSSGDYGKPTRPNYAKSDEN
jgi:hypothetical protein